VPQAKKFSIKIGSPKQRKAYSRTLFLSPPIGLKNTIYTIKAMDKIPSTPTAIRKVFKAGFLYAVLVNVRAKIRIHANLLLDK
jgi:hypothetical protein